MIIIAEVFIYGGFQPIQPNPDAFFCDRCGKEITGAVGKNGEEIVPEECLHAPLNEQERARSAAEEIERIKHKATVSTHSLPHAWGIN